MDVSADVVGLAAGSTGSVSTKASGKHKTEFSDASHYSCTSQKLASPIINLRRGTYLQKDHPRDS